jgi:hypothetical protein
VNLPGLSALPLSALPLRALPPQTPLLQASKSVLLFPRLAAFRCVLEFLWLELSSQLPLLLQIPPTHLLV